MIQDVLNQEYWSTNRENPKTIRDIRLIDARALGNKFGDKLIIQDNAGYIFGSLVFITSWIMEIYLISNFYSYSLEDRKNKLPNSR